jgi:F-type H+-transporting ATPase subunit delta
MAELITIARPYARAAFEAARDGSALPQWSRFLARAAAAVQDPQVQLLIGNPRVHSNDLIELLLEVGEAGPATGAGAAAVSPQALEAQRNFLALLAHNQRLPLLPEVAAQYEELRAEAENVADVQVLSARELTAEQSQKLQNALERRLGRKIRLHTRVDATLLGGAIVNFGDYVVDGSLRRRVERLAATLSGS